ncbi:hypothetical protein FIU28_17005 [Tardiphaga sp. vice154]|uniref:hypothetical protein n=1 Tax=Tardiphaga sp. vice154 TaxID=2592814 RepID=UPI00116471E0|nr:hypothetical protein [Tardiphaga sp. vice154]QDM22659.1 hypothetical protein FIU28_17005 [Tardiphaga sp. vice154]
MTSVRALIANKYAPHVGIPNLVTLSKPDANPHAIGQMLSAEYCGCQTWALSDYDLHILIENDDDATARAAFPLTVSIDAYVSTK